MIARLQHAGGFIRVWADDQVPYTDPFAWSCGVNWIDHETAELVAFRNEEPEAKLTNTAMRSVMQELSDHGAKYVRMKRIRKNRDPYFHIVDLSRSFSTKGSQMSSTETPAAEPLQVTTPGNLREVKLVFTVDWDDNPNNLPGHEMTVIYRDMPPAGLAALQQELAGVHQRMAAFGASLVTETK